MFDRFCWETFSFYSAEKLKIAIFMVGEIGGNEIDAITESIISTKKKKKFLFIFLSKLIVMIIDS